MPVDVMHSGNRVNVDGTPWVESLETKWVILVVLWEYVSRMDEKPTTTHYREEKIS